MYKTIEQTAKEWGISARQVSAYCKAGRIPGAKKDGKIWLIPENAQKPERKPRREQSLLDRLCMEKNARLSGGLYHRLQIDLAYNSNHIEGSKLTHDQTRYIYETSTIGLENTVVRVDDIIETVNHFRCVDQILDTAKFELTEKYIKNLHALLKSGTTDSRQAYLAVGDYKRLENEVGGRMTTPPEQVHAEMADLLESYRHADKTLETLIDFHVRFERIHPFQDGNGRVGRLILLKECLRYHIVPFIITDELKLYYYRGLQNWDTERSFLTDTCLTAQDAMKRLLDRFRIPYIG